LPLWGIYDRDFPERPQVKAQRGSITPVSPFITIFEMILFPSHRFQQMGGWKVSKRGDMEKSKLGFFAFYFLALIMALTSCGGEGIINYLPGWKGTKQIGIV